MVIAFGVAARLATWLTFAPVIGSQLTACPPTVHTSTTTHTPTSVAPASTYDAPTTTSTAASTSACPATAAGHDCTTHSVITEDQRMKASMFCGEVFANQTEKGVNNAVDSLIAAGYTASEMADIVDYAVTKVCTGARAIVDQTILGTSSTTPTTTSRVPSLHVA